MPSYKRKETARSGQALLETCLAIMVICLIFAGLMQVSQIFSAREVLQHAATSGVRAKTVGFNKWMVQKVVQVAAIPNSGAMLTPGYRHTEDLPGVMRNTTPGGFWSFALHARPSSEQYDVERARIPQYLASWNHARAAFELDYVAWREHTIRYNADSDTAGMSGVPMLHVNMTQEYPLWAHWHESFYEDDDRGIKLAADSYMEDHYPLYIDDQDW
jgi:hypothetical protein